MLLAPKACHLHLQKRYYDLSGQEVCHLRRHSIFVHELDMPTCGMRAKVTCFVWRAERSRDFGWYARLVYSNTMCGIFHWRENKPKAGHVILSSFELSSIDVPKFFICGRENKIGTSPV